MNASPYARLLGLPVAYWGAAVYLALLILALLPGKNAASAFLGLNLAAFLFSAYLTLAEVVFIRALCSWCLVSFAVLTLLLPLAGLRLRLEGQPQSLFHLPHPPDPDDAA